MDVLCASSAQIHRVVWHAVRNWRFERRAVCISHLSAPSYNEDQWIRERRNSISTHHFSFLKIIRMATGTSRSISTKTSTTQLINVRTGGLAWRMKLEINAIVQDETMEKKNSYMKIKVMIPIRTNGSYWCSQSRRLFNGSKTLRQMANESFNSSVRALRSLKKRRDYHHHRRRRHSHPRQLMASSSVLTTTNHLYLKTSRVSDLLSRRKWGHFRGLFDKWQRENLLWSFIEGKEKEA